MEWQEIIDIELDRYSLIEEDQHETHRMEVSTPGVIF